MMPVSSSTTVTTHSFNSTPATNLRFSIECTIGRKVSRRYDAKNSSAIASASRTVA
jgi:hypothetical protein